MNLTENEKRMIYQAESLLQKLRSLPDNECTDLVRDIQKNYRLTHGPKTIGELLAEARQASGAERLSGHDIMALERFAPDSRHMAVFDVLSGVATMGDKGDRMRLFLTEQGYRKCLEQQDKGRRCEHAEFSYRKQHHGYGGTR